MLGNNSDINQRRIERYHSSQYTVGDAYRDYANNFNQTIERAMSTKVLIQLFNWVGIPAYLLSLLNVFGFKTFDEGKQFILFTLAAMFGIARLVVYCIENYQRLRYRSREEAKRRKWDEKQ